MVSSTALLKTPTAMQKWRCKIRVAFCAYFLLGGLTSALADRINTQSIEFAYRSSGTCMASPEGFNSKVEPINSGVAWITTFASVGRVDGHGAGTEIGQAVDTASFGVGPRMHMPGASVYEVSFTATISRTETGGVVFRANEASGTFTAGPYAGRTLSLSGFQLKRTAAENAAQTFGSVDSPVVQAVSLGGGAKFERICVMTLSTFPAQSNIH